MAMDDETLSVRAQLEDELSGPIRGVRREIEDLERSADRANKKMEDGGKRATKAQLASQRSISDLSRSYGSLSQSIQRASSSANGLIAAVGTRSAQGFAIGAAAATAYGLKANASIEQMKISLTTMFGNDGGTKLFSQLTELSNMTPFSQEQQIQLGQNLSAFGVAQESILGLSTAISNIASGQTNPLDALQRIGRAVGQIQSRGRLAGDEMMQLSEAGVNMAKVLAPVYGTTEAGLTKALNNGAIIPADVAIKAIQNLTGDLSKFAGMSERQSQTLAGQWSTFSSKTKQKTAEAFQPLADQLKTVLPGFTIRFGAFIDKTAPGIGRIGIGLIKLVDALLPLAGPVIAGALNGFAGWIEKATPGIERMGQGGESAGKGVGEFFAAVGNIIPGLMSLTIAMAPVLSDLTTLAVHILPIVTTPLRIFADVLSAVTANSNVASYAIGGTVAAFLGIAVISKVFGTIRTAIGLLTGLSAAAKGGGALGGVGKFGKGLGMLGIGGLGAGLLAEGMTQDNALVGGLESVGGGAVLGATIGSVIPGVGTVVGGVAGGVAGGLAYGAKKLLGNSGDVHGNLGRSLGTHSAIEAATPGSRSITSSVRSYGLSGPNSGHTNGTALDVHGSWMAGYVQSARKMGAAATMHDAGSGLHVHGAYGDTPMAPGPGAAGAGAYGTTIINLNVTANTPMDFYAIVDDVITRRDRNNLRRAG